MEEQRTSRSVVWWRAFRYHFVPPSIFPAVLGGVISWAVDRIFSPWYFLLVLIAIVSNHMALNMTDDYFDYKHSVDSLKPGEKNPYTGGSGTLSAGLLSPTSMFVAFTVCYAITASIGIYLAFTRGLIILVIGFFGGFCSVFYTAPPISFSHHGLGELGLLVNFGTVIGLGSYFVQAQRLTLEAFLATLPMGIMLFSMIVINEIPDLEEDKRAGKLTLVARYGRKNGIRIYVFSWVSTYAVIIGGAIAQIMPATALLALASLPLVYKSIKTLRRHYDNPMLLAPANLDMIRAHSVTSLGLIFGYAVQGLINNASFQELGVILLLLAIFYAPAGISLIKTGKRSEG